MPKKILIIDDEEDMRIYIQTIFRKGGFETEMAVNGEDALDKLDNFAPDLITLDILMPRKSGLNFFKSLRQRDGMSNVPVIVVSGVTGNSEFFEDEDVGPTYFMEKPVEPDKLLGKARELTGA
ncbi:MAG: response regulator [candidate division Zixibacteria bacterium]|nr:response regulator [candidate division Zixibacteria bacterium]